MYTDEGCLIDLFKVTLHIIDDAKFDLFKELIGGDVPESLQTDEYMDFIYRVFKVERVKGEIMEEKKLSEFLKENGAYESFIENCLNTEDILQSIIDYSLSNIGIKNGFLWGFTPQGFIYWSKLHSEISKLNITNDMDEILYKEYEKRNMKESSEQNPITKDIVEVDGESKGNKFKESLKIMNNILQNTSKEEIDKILQKENMKQEDTKQEFQTIILNGIEYNLIPKEISVGYIANWQDKVTRAETTEEYLKRKFEEDKGKYEVLFKEKKSKDWAFWYRPCELSWRKDWEYKLIKKEHKEIVEAYLKDRNTKIEYHINLQEWENKWMPCAGDLIENYDEDYCYRIAKKEFEPFTLNIEVNTLDEAKSLWNRFNLNNDTLCKSMGSPYYNVELQNIINDMKYWKQLDTILKDLGEEPDANKLYETKEI